ncbi:alpha/beta fold hydrolase [Halofilum ochraceum]|uniref:alpha/beta fold hydrolase n=1 Tax=Halofilum ochraceum TaxID=1611323 RepID=UPI0008355FDF|nr:alpha/beta hydrolase [Halofilum ochraceum]
MSTAGSDELIYRCDGRRVGWCEFGDPRGWPLVYCHGTPGSRLEGALFARAAAARGIRIIAVDRPGYGDTAPLPERALGDEVGDIEALLDNLGVSRFDVLGFSGGGPYAMACGARQPERVRRLGLISSVAPFNRVGKEGMADGYRQLWELAESDLPAFEETFEAAIAASGDGYELLLGGASDSDREILQSNDVVDPYRRNLREAMRAGLAGMFGDVRALVAPWFFDVTEVRAPTFIWHGACDANAPVDMGRWLERNLPVARLIEWPGAAHFEVFRRPGEVLDGYTTP